ncbi:class I adenylate-forming enzyme family protein [Prauserella cavernicola]|uniref:Acyl--CoA ligase n=1 Tax=Prauserella cavernicola TaxID=2800127 RepID=A0A934QVE9_9PSEU|nr:class I adenylate-forming enzyme family protein [Prauserella cavernicola]MBK1787098.1 acyl--CoA ligase [Prauserella cavernicola]
MVLDDKRRLELLTAPGGAFPLRDRTVGGRTVTVFDRDPRTLRDAFLALRRHGDALAIGYRDEHYSHADVWARTARLAHVLRDEFGIAKGDRVGIAMRNYPEFVFVFGAAQLLGAVAVPFNAWLKGPELAELVAEAKPTVLFADRERIQLTRDAGIAAPQLIGVRCAELPDGVTDYAELLGELSPELDAPETAVTPDDVATILFTSGTTGRPKAAVHTHLNHSASLLNKLIRAVPVTEPDDGGPVVVSPPPRSCKLVTFPFFHIAGLNTLYNTLYAGQSLILMYKWDASEAVRLIEAERVTELSGPPYIVQTFLSAARDTGRDLSSLRALGMGGAAAPAHVIEQARAVLGEAVIPRTGYGMTETTSGVVAISAADFARRPASVGRALPTAEIAILDREGKVLGADSEGEVAVRGPQVIQGYEGAESDESFSGGWFRTGDLGRIDADGFVFLVGRIKDIVIRGGENISCSEVEVALGSHPQVHEAAALGAPHPALGEELVAIVHLADGSTVSAEDLRDHTAARLAPFKVPARIAIIHRPLPRTASGKVVKRELAGELNLGWLLDPATAS